VIEDLAAAVARGGFAFGRIFRDELEQILGLEVPLRGGFELLRQFRIGSAPGVEGLRSTRRGGGALGLEIGEVGLHFIADVEMRAFRDAEAFFGGIDELRAAFAVALGRAGDFGDAFADDRLGDDDLRLAVVVVLGGFDGAEDRVEVVTVDGHRVPSRSRCKAPACPRSA
jgi:hypothetical protein